MLSGKICEFTMRLSSITQKSVRDEQIERVNLVRASGTLKKVSYTPLTQIFANLAHGNTKNQNISPLKLSSFYSFESVGKAYSRV